LEDSGSIGSSSFFRQERLFSKMKKYQELVKRKIFFREGSNVVRLSLGSGRRTNLHGFYRSFISCVLTEEWVVEQA